MSLWYNTNLVLFRIIYSILIFSFLPIDPPIATEITFLNIPSLVGIAHKAISLTVNPSIYDYGITPLVLTSVSNFL